MRLNIDGFTLVDLSDEPDSMKDELINDTNWLANCIEREINCSIDKAKRIATNGKLYRYIELPEFGSISVKISGSYIITISNNGKTLVQMCDKIVHDREFLYYIVESIFSQVGTECIPSYLKEQLSTYCITNNKLTDDQKLMKIFNLYKSETKTVAPQLYYALLAWKDNHIHDINERRDTE